MILSSSCSEMCSKMCSKTQLGSTYRAAGVAESLGDFNRLLYFR